MKIKISDYELGWLVGLLEGEGHFGLEGKCQRVDLQMTDQDVVDSAARIINKLTGESISATFSPRSRETAQDIYRIRVSGESARIVMKTVVPHMHARRRARIWQCLNRYTPPKKKSLKELGFDINQLLKKEPAP